MDSNTTNPPPPPPPAPDSAGAGGGENKPPPQPVREDYVQNAVKFLSHPKVRGSAVVYRRSFLQNKGLTNDEIDEAFRRVPQPNMYGVPNGDFGSGRPSFAPAPAEPTSGSFSRSYVETVQRGDRSSGSKQPWEMQQQYTQPKLGYGSNSNLSEDGSYSEAQENYAPSYHQNGKAPDFHTEEPRPLAYSTGAEERPPPQRRWVPPQPPGVAMPEAAAAIRQPKSLAKQPSSDTSEAAGDTQLNGAAQSSSSVAPAEAAVNNGATSDAGRGDIEDQVEAI